MKSSNADFMSWTLLTAYLVGPGVRFYLTEPTKKTGREKVIEGLLIKKVLRCQNTLKDCQKNGVKDPIWEVQEITQEDGKL